MSDDDVFCESEFSGVARLFPLPELVVFPHVVQALHIFEPRYRSMLADTLQGDHLIAMATLLPSLKEQGPSPSIAPQVCLTRILSEKRLPDGCSNILVLGVRRAAIVRELPLVRPYREAELRLVPDCLDGVSSPAADVLHQELKERSSQVLSIACPGLSLEEVFGQKAHLGLLTDLLAYAMPLSTDDKLTLLSESGCLARARKLIECMRRWEPESGAGDRGRPKFPPTFSDN